MKVSERIIKYCDDNQIAQREFADKIGMTEIGISRVVRGERLPQLIYLKNMSILFGITLDELLEDEGKSDDEELKPCPFCGGKAELKKESGDYGYTPDAYIVECTWCGARIRKESSSYNDLSHAVIVDWNRRR